MSVKISQAEHVRDECQRLQETSNIFLCGDFQSTRRFQKQFKIYGSSKLANKVSPKGCGLCLKTLHNRPKFCSSSKFCQALKVLNFKRINLVPAFS